MAHEHLNTSTANKPIIPDTSDRILFTNGISVPSVWPGANYYRFFCFLQEKCDFYSWIYILCFGQWSIDAEDDDEM